MTNQITFTLEEIKNWLISKESTDINDLLADLSAENITAANIKDEGGE